MAENDDFFGPEGAKALESKLTGMGKDVSITVHSGTGHAFMGPHNALGTLDEELAEATVAAGHHLPARHPRLTPAGRRPSGDARASASHDHV